MIFITLAILPWVGGKQALFKTIIKRFPSDYRRRTYVEVFGGGGTMLLNKDRSVKEIFNDANGNLINLYRVVRQQPEEPMRRLSYVLNSKADFILTKEQIKLGQYHDPVQWAADYYQIIKQSYAGKGSTFGANPRSMWAAFPLIDAVCARLQYVVIENADFGKIIPANDSPNTIFYLDPPYYFTEDYYPGQIFTQADHYRLFETIMSIKGLWLLSYNFCPETVDLYSKPGLYIEKLERPNNMAQKYDPGSMYEEILVSNFDTSKPLPLQMSLSGDVPEERNFMMEKRLTALWSVNFAVKTLRILGKRGRVTVPQEVRDEIGLERGDVVSFAVVDEDSVLIKKERLCDNCVTQTNQTDMMKLLVQAMHFAKPGESAQDAFEFLTGLTPPQRFEMCKRLCSQSSHNFGKNNCRLGRKRNRGPISLRNFPAGNSSRWQKESRTGY